MLMLESPRDRDGLCARPSAGSAEELIRALYEITSDYGRGFENQVERILRLGCERFGLEIGILSRVIGDRYEILRAKLRWGDYEALSGDEHDLPRRQELLENILNEYIC